MGLVNALQDFADYCDRVGLEARPTVWAQYVDVWGTPRGEMGVADVTVNDLPNTCFALLTPWATIPTLGSVSLVVDWLTDLRVVDLKVNMRGIYNPSWSVPYTLSDSGRMSFGTPTPAEMLSTVSLAVAAAKRARTAQTMWRDDYSVDSILPVVTHLLNKEGRK